jgi:hypothetical protein
VGGSSSATGGSGPSTGTGGTSTEPDASAGGGTPGTGGSTGTGGSSPGTGGATPTGAGGGTPGTGGTRGTGGTPVVDAGRDTGTPGTGGAPAADGGDLLAVANVLQGKMFLGPCMNDTQASVCQTIQAGTACPGVPNGDRALAGVLTTDMPNLTFGGNAGQMYSVTLHVQGEVESKQYPGGTDQNGTLTSPRADGFCVGGTPTNVDAYNVYMIRVTAPGAATHQDYFLNSLQTPGVSNHTTYGIDYMATLHNIAGGSNIRLVAADSNCSMIKNCGPIVNDGNTCNGAIIQTNIEPTAIAANPTFNFNTGYNGQWIVLTVKGVTSP